MVTAKRQPKIAHKIPGRLRIKLPSGLTDKDARSLLQDLKSSPEVKTASLTRSSLVIEHNDGDNCLTDVGSALNKVFPEFERWSDEVDAEIAKYVSDPWVNKSVPFAFLGLAFYRGIMDGAILAGESAFALAYIAFDIYWKFQQENVIRKIEKGLSQNQKLNIETEE